MKKVILFSAMLTFVCIMAGCNTKEASGSTEDTDNSVSNVIIDLPPENSGYSQRTQTTDEWEFRYDEQLGGIIITDCLCANERSNKRVYNAVDDVVVPSEFEGFEGLKVLEIAPNALGDLECNSITLPDGLLYIDKDAFAYSIITEPLIIPQSVTDMSEDALHCLFCDEVELPPLEIIPKNLFEGSNIKRLTLPSTVTKIEEYAFNKCYYLAEFICDENLKEIGDYAFCGCGNLETITFNEGLEQIGLNAFADTTKLSMPVYLPDTLTTIKYSHRVWAFGTTDFSGESLEFVYKGETYKYSEIIELIGNEE